MLPLRWFIFLIISPLFLSSSIALACIVLRCPSTSRVSLEAAPRPLFLSTEAWRCCRRLKISRSKCASSLPLASSRWNILISGKNRKLSYCLFSTKPRNRVQYFLCIHLINSIYICRRANTLIEKKSIKL